MTSHKSEACRAEIQMKKEMAKKKGAAKVLLQLLLFERGDDKRCVPDTANRRESLQTW